MPVGTIDYRNRGSRGPSLASVATVVSRALSGGGGGGVERRDLDAEAEMRRIAKQTEEANLKRRYNHPTSQKMFAERP